MTPARIGLGIFTIALCYLAFSFVGLDLNCTHWPENRRFTLVLVSLPLAIWLMCNPFMRWAK